VAATSLAVLIEGDKTRILVVDDHTTFAELLISALDREADLCSVGFASNAEDAVAQFLTLRPDVVVMDQHLPDASGFVAAARILAYAPETRIMMLTGDATSDALEKAAALGVCAFLPKDGSLATMLSTLRHAAHGGIMVHPSLLAQLSARRPVQTDRAGLTRRELEVLRLMAAGGDVRSNSNALGISQNTCRGYVKSILAKLGSHSQLEAVATSARMGLLTGSGDA
jgi:DNA-binding NarL/FixJ family response regulator